MIRFRRLPRSIVLPTAGGAVLGGVAGMAAIRERGSVEFAAARIEGLAAIASVSALLALMGLLLGLTFWLTLRALQAAAHGDRK